MPAPTNPGPDLRRLIALAVGLCVLAFFAAPTIDWLPTGNQERLTLGALLGAQAAFAALTLAVTTFVLQTVTTKRDADDRAYREYLRRSLVRPIFGGSVAAVGFTGVMLLAAARMPDAIFLGALAFVANLLLALLLFEKAIQLTRPDAWRRLGRDVKQIDVRNAVDAFLRRHRRAAARLEADEPDFADIIPDPGEGSADEAVRALLGDARRAMDERLHADFGDALEAIKELVEYAMDQLQRERYAWRPPGSQAEWPPLAELGRNLYAFREEVISRGNRDHAFALSSLDYWLLTRGIRHRCGELFTVGLDGYGRNYEIARRSGSGNLREMFRDRAWTTLPWLLAEMTTEEGLPYLRHTVRQQELLLSDAMHNQDSADFNALMNGFSDLLRHLRPLRGGTRRPLPESVDRFEALHRAYRIALMGLGGRAISLTEEERVADPQAYLEAIRREYTDVQQLAADASGAFALRPGEWSLASDWEMEGAGNAEPRWIRPERYSLNFFTVRLVELARDPMPVLDLGGRAQEVLDWFEQNIEQLERHVRLEPDTSPDDVREEPVPLDPKAAIAERRELAIAALEAAVVRDEVAADEEVARRELSEERIAVFTADVYEAAFSNNAIERLFARAGAFEYLASAADRGPEERRASQYVSKGFLATEPENARTHYGQLPGDEWGESHADDVVTMLREALGEAPDIEAPLDSGEDLLSAIDAAVDSLEPDGSLVLFLSGDWDRVTFDLAMDPPDGYESRLGREPVHTLEQGIEARYHGHPIIWDRADGERRLYVVEPSTWGCFIRQQAEGDTDLLVEVEPIPEERAREMLSENPNHLPDVEDQDAKLRKLQTFVRVGVAARTGFRVTDPTRARRVLPPASA